MARRAHACVLGDSLPYDSLVNRRLLNDILGKRGRTPVEYARTRKGGKERRKR